MGKCDEASVEVNMGDSASPMKPDNFTFTVPPEAPVFEPTPEEFLDPLAYINKIRPLAEKSGICKIKPPQHWQPPFAVDVDRLRFTPRIQRLNELEAITRVKLNFLDQIIKFWELQGSVLKIPTVEKKPLDLYALHKIVKEASGFEVCSAERKWSKIARRMGFPQGKGIGSILKSHYERILYPYDVFKSSGAVGDTKEGILQKVEVKGEQTPEKVFPGTRSGARSGTKSSPSPSPASPAPSPRRYKLTSPVTSPEPAAEGSHAEGALPDTKALVKEENGETRRSPRENKWVVSGGAGAAGGATGGAVGGATGGAPRVTRSTRLREHRMSNMTVSVTPAPALAAPVAPTLDPLAKYMCRNCGRGDIEEQMLLCDGCDDSYHTFCLLPPLADVPKGDWRCPVCIAEEVSKPTEAFGFEQASREYTLQQFGEMADQFKSDYFNMPVHMVPTSTVEKEFWRVVSSIDEDVTVEYGADLHSMDHGSGFPHKSSSQLYPGEQQYAESGWNLNNLPVLDGSVLGHIHADISGMKIPWLYVGMCFATFCWHNEDHWSYSINYLHWGEPKTWYGVPGSKAEQFEAAMKAEAPELFQLQPDLLHQLVTIMNPNILMKAGVPVYRTDQHAGEFVITFPRAYHAGFNQGYNFAEAVNFTPPDWLKMGRECIAHYSTLRRYCVFSHDELVCKMALEADRLSLTVALAAYRDMRTMLLHERKLRKHLLDWGVTKAEREAFELVPDDSRQCAHCLTTCFLSCVTCSCTVQVVCLRHRADLCRCEPDKHTLRYRYTLDELGATLELLKRKSDAFREWAEAVREALDPDTPKTCDLDRLRAHRARARDLKIHKTELVRALEQAIEEAEKCASVIQQLDLNKMRTRTRQHDPKYRLTIEELRLFAEEIDALVCVLPEGSAVKEVLRQTEEFERRASELLSEPLDETDSHMLRELEEVVELGSQLCIVLDQLPPLQARLSQVRFLEEVKSHREEEATLTPEVIDKLLKDALSVVPHTRVEAERSYLTMLKAEVEEWESRARSLLCSEAGKQRGAAAVAAATAAAGVTSSSTGTTGTSSSSTQYCTMSEVASLLAAGRALPACPPARSLLATAHAHARDWLLKVEEMQSKDLYPYYHTVETLVKKGQAIPLALYEKDQLSAALLSAKEWKEGAALMFLNKPTSKQFHTYTLMEALSPRTEAPRGRRRRPPCAAPSQPPPAGPSPAPLHAGDAPLDHPSFLKHFSEDSSPTEIVAAFKQAEHQELQLIKDLRLGNMRKDVRGAPTAGVLFCYCQKRQYGLMSQCELCKDWFHANCIQAVKEARAAEAAADRAREAAAGDAGGDTAEGEGGEDPSSLPFPRPEPKFLCPDCRRTKRPRLERILALLVWLQKLPVRMCEGEALQCVTERAMAWQDSARAALAAPQLALHLAPPTADLPLPHQGRRDRSDHINAQLKKANGRTHDAHTTQNARSSASVEHAYSAPPHTGAGGSGGRGVGGDKGEGRASPKLLQKLEELMLEGDLLEVTLDEQAHVWSAVVMARGGARSCDAGRLKRRQRPSRPHHQLKRTRPHHTPTAAAAVLPKTVKRGNATTTNYLNRKQGMSTSGLMMRKHYMARQERRKRGVGGGVGGGGRGGKHQRARHSNPSRGGGGSGAGPSGRGAGTGGGTRRTHTPPPPGSGSSSDDSSNDDEEDCAAANCLRPTGKEVDWVQCDGGCDQWFHMHCVGLDRTALRPDDDYVCGSCLDAIHGNTEPTLPDN